MGKVDAVCDYCGVQFQKQSWELREHNFCCFDHFRFFASERMAQMNKDMNPERMTPEVRKKLRAARLNTGDGKTYTKEYGRHAHRIAAEKKLGRPLKPGEVVHHIDENKRNNDPANLIIFPSQREHARYHTKMRAFFAKTGGDVE